MRVVRAFDKEQSEIDRFEDANALLTGMQLHVGHLSALMNPLTYVLINLAIVALLYVGSIEINVGGMASGDVIALVNYMNQILVELVKLANLIVQISKALALSLIHISSLATPSGTASIKKGLEGYRSARPANCCCPVSYTHLAVPGSPGAAPLPFPWGYSCGRGNPKNRAGGCNTPVSYTHLDVYKRQISLMVYSVTDTSLSP